MNAGHHNLRALVLLHVFVLTSTPACFAENRPPPMMKAIVIHQYGGPEVLRFEEVPRPEPKDDQILVRVMAAGVNPVDGLIRSGMFGKGEGTVFPIILGGDIAGVVEKVGRKITKFKQGDPVFAYASLGSGGGYAQYALTTEREAAPKPKSLTYILKKRLRFHWPRQQRGRR